MRKCLGMVGVYHRAATFKGDRAVTKSMLSIGRGEGRGGANSYQSLACGLWQGNSPIVYVQLLSVNVIGEYLRGCTSGVISAFEIIPRRSVVFFMINHM